MRIKKHPILDARERREISFSFNGHELAALEGEPISSALIANDIHVFGHHHEDGSPQGIFCVNGQCSQCLVIADGKAVKSCMVPVQEGMKVFSCDKIPELTADDRMPEFKDIEELVTEVLIIGGGPSGICAALELGRAGVHVLLVDDKMALGGKLSLQTHSFFGSQAGCWAGTRGIDIARILSEEIADCPTVRVMLNTAAVGCFSDHKIGVVRNTDEYFLIKPRVLLVASGAREKTVTFPGCDLPGVYGAGAFQTLVNRDLVRSAENLFILGGGNVGLIGAYHAIQAGIKVLGLAEVLPQCGGYKVHMDKIARLGVPIFTSHTVVRAVAGANERLKSVIIAQVDDKFKIIPGTEKSFEVDTLLVAVGLTPVNELYLDAVRYGIQTYVAGDAAEIAEASAAIFGGKIVGRKIARDMGRDVEIPDDWAVLQKVLQSKPGRTVEYKACQSDESRVYPLIRCIQEIPCDPCSHYCPKRLIKLVDDSIMSLPEFKMPGSEKDACSGCGQCVMACPGLAISLIYPTHDPEKKTVKLMLPFELDRDLLEVGKEVECVNFDGAPVCQGKILEIKPRKNEKRCLVFIEIPYGYRFDVATFRLEQPVEPQKPEGTKLPEDDEIIVCRCGRVTREQVKEEISKGVRDLNALKATLRTGMGACGGKTCNDLILQIFRQEGIDLKEVAAGTRRPLLTEVPLSAFVGEKEEE
jgi:sarcosine oxidase, subunit alpha